MNAIYTSTNANRTTPAFSAEENIILCITSLHHRRYIEDIIHVIGLPIGSHVRLRYRKPYVAQAYWDMLNSGSISKNYKALIAVTGLKEDGTSTIIPLRKGSIVSARCDGDLAIVDIAIHEYIFTASLKTTFFQSLSTVAKNLPNDTNNPGHSPAHYLQPLSMNPKELSANSTVKGWEKVAAKFFEIDNALKLRASESLIPFLYHIKKLNGKETKRLEKRGQLFIKMGSKFDIDIHTIARPTGQAIRNPLGEIVIDLSHTAASFISSRRVRVDSSRDVKTIGLTTTPLFSNADGHLSIRMNIFKNEEADTSAVDGSPASKLISASKRTELTLARYDFPLRVGGIRPLLASGLIAGAAALSVYKFSTQGEFKVQDALIPGIVFILTFFGLSLGIIKK